MATITTNNNTFKLPEIYHFPPLFTIQPVETTRIKQLESWCHIITEYHKFHKKTILSINTFELFNNKKIQRSLNTNDRIVIMEHIIKKGYGDWLNNNNNDNNNKTQCMIFYKTINEWVKIISDYARSYNLIGDVFTIYDLIQGDDASNEEFHGLDHRVFYRILAQMQKQNLCQVYDNSNIEEVGVKFI